MRAEISFGKSLIGILFVGLAAAGCTTTPKPAATAAKTKVQPAKVTFNYTNKDRDCLQRAMYFESQHSDEDGYMAVGTVVMNRLTSGAYPPSICGVVAQEKQFAPGVMTREVKPQAETELATAADAILKGARHPAVKDAMFFHTDGLKFPYNNMHYVAVAGGNAFYEKRGADGMLQTPPPLPAYEVAMNYVPGESILPPQFEALIPSAVPVPLPAPDPMPTASTMSPINAAPTAAHMAPVANPMPMQITAPVTEPEPSIEPDPGMRIAIPIPRPAYDSVMLRGSVAANGG
ncbi:MULTISPECIES: cell wall hydrolase [unclassified Rhizobium]|uniref:cell wall hydrolase n=1 Tax=unclassified Rhizobium TaxID=2613769 RepID=UPI0007EB80B9|nr:MULTISPECIES: cell wall hydrolase [unclassified Rhizobium]ANM14087.1 cell wall hydrolase SleB-like protein [Rhizobium sp. N324]ANM20469.1 cell wall hydrolase SleB-like protein [Rhizobium sp. N541]ANM26853.1 cell wall hydrolase SleB-like protein [Rhizobium sp. N941]OYD00260.1 cell wall hydrolase SleB-like protein [Rhizobium sp. N4311]